MCYSVCKDHSHHHEVKSFPLEDLYLHNERDDNQQTLFENALEDNDITYIVIERENGKKCALEFVRQENNIIVVKDELENEYIVSINQIVDIE